MDASSFPPPPEGLKGSGRPLRVLVTGGRGLIGSNVLGAIRRERPGWEAVSASRSADVLQPGAFRLDLLDPTKVREALEVLRPDAVLHVAGAPGASDWAQLWDAHVTATFHLMEAVRALPPSMRPSVVVVGSAAEYGAQAGLRVQEDALPRPVTPYGAAKLAQTHTALAYRTLGVRVSVARIFNLIGPGLPRRLSGGSFARQIAAIERGERPPRLETGNLESVRDFVDVRDAALALTLLLEKAEPGEAYNIATGTGVRIREVAGTLLAMCRVPAALAPAEGPPSPSGLDRSVGDPSKLEARTGWRPRRTLRESLADTLEWARAAGPGEEAIRA